MPDFIQTATADVNGAATLTLQKIPVGLEWVIQQIGVNVTLPAGVTPMGTCVCNIYRNNKLIGSTSQGRAGSAGGQPYYRLTASDDLQIEWTNAGAGLQCVATISYSEHGAGMANSQNTGIV